MMVSETVQQFLAQHVRRGAKLLVAISGGPDSVVLAHVLKSLPYPIHLGHVDHQIRKNSFQDSQFVQRLAMKWDISCTRSRVHVPSHALARQEGIEEAARELRYEALAKMARRTGCSVIVTAHHAGDQAETVLMNLLRGAGPAGLAGIPPIRALERGLRILRPFLKIRRQEILSYAKAHHLPYRTDPSNRDLKFNRNRIRHRTLPYLSKQYPGLAVRLGQTADVFREEEAFWNQTMQPKIGKTMRKNNKKIAVDLEHLLGYHKALGRRILRQILPGSSFQDIERVYNLARSLNGTRNLQLPGDLLVTRQGQKLVIHLKPRDL